MNALSGPISLTALLTLVPDQIPAINEWREDFDPVLAAGKKGRQQRLAAIAQRRDIPLGTVVEKFHLYRKQGAAGLINRRHAPALWESKRPRGLSEADKELVETWCEKWQRSSEAAIRAMLRAWREQRVSQEMIERGLAVPQTHTPLGLDGYPEGWSLRNLMRHRPSDYALKAARIGRGAARSLAPLVYTTRADLYVGQFYLFDDMWHDHVVNDLDQRRSGRPLEFHALDLSSACKFGWGNRIRLETELGHQGLNNGDFRFLLASILVNTGYHPRGTTLVVENAAASIDSDLEQLLYDATDGMIKVARGAMLNAAAHAGQYAGRSKGNFRFKASLESLGNLIHNEMAYLPGQVGKDRNHSPEQMHDGGRFLDPATGKPLTKFGAMKHNDALLKALAYLPPERREWLQWDFCSLQQFRLICDEIYGRINRRDDHELEGWDLRMVPDPRTGRMRRLSPHEWFSPRRRELQPIGTDTAALILGSHAGVPRSVIGNMIVVHDGEISGDEIRFSALHLPDRAKYRTVINPFDPTRLFCYDAKDRFVAALDRINKPSRGDVEAVHREMGRAAAEEARLLDPLQRRANAEARQKLARHQHNAAVLGGDTAADREERQRLADESADLGEFAAGAAPGAPVQPVDLSDLL